jgi:hypothetical protein
MIMRRKVEAGELTEEEAQAMMNGTTLRPPRMKKWMWPTPQAADHLANQSETLEAWEKRAAEKKKEGINLQFALRHAVQKDPTMWPTPKASGQEKLDTLIKRKGVRAAVQHNLTAAVEMWPTPTVNDSKNNAGPSQFRRKGTNLNVAVAKRGTDGGTLNPTWVEWLMGYQEGYTDLKDWEILSSRKSSKKSAKR